MGVKPGLILRPEYTVMAFDNRWSGGYLGMRRKKEVAVENYTVVSFIILNVTKYYRGADMSLARPTFPMHFV